MYRNYFRVKGLNRLSSILTRFTILLMVGTAACVAIDILPMLGAMIQVFVVLGYLVITFCTFFLILLNENFREKFKELGNFNNWSEYANDLAIKMKNIPYILFSICIVLCIVCIITYIINKNYDRKTHLIVVPCVMTSLATVFTIIHMILINAFHY